MKLLNNKASKFFVNFTKANYERIDVKSGACRFNFRCQMNAAHDAFDKKQKKFAMTIYIDEGQPIIHFVNFDGKIYIDNTLGHWSKFNKYYFVKWINEPEFWIVDEIFDRFQKHLRRQLPWYVRWFSDYEC